MLTQMDQHTAVSDEDWKCPNPFDKTLREMIDFDFIDFNKDQNTENVTYKAALL